MEKKDDFTFEKGIERLTEIANDLEAGTTALDDSISKFEEGVKISKKCNELLNNAELRIKKVIEENREIKEEDFKV